MTAPAPPIAPRPADSLILAGVIELLAGGVPSTHPACPGAIFQLQPEYNTGAPQPTADVVAKLLQGGSRPHGRWADNRTVSLPVLIRGADRGTIVAGRELLAQLTDAQQYTVAWQRAGAHGPMILDAFRANPPVPAYSIIEERQDFCRVVINFQALPYGRSDLRETLWFPGGATGGPPAPYPPPVVIDDYPVGSVSLTQPESWNIVTDRPGTPPNPNSAHWGPLRGNDTPVYRRLLWTPAVPGDTADLTGTIDIAGRAYLTLWAGMGNSNGQWRGGNQTFQFTLWDVDGTVLEFGGTGWFQASDRWDRPVWQLASFPMPQGSSFGPLAEYQVEAPTFTTTAQMGDLYLHLMGAAPPATKWENAPSPRADVYILRSAGTARAPVSLRAQTPARTFQWTDLFPYPADDQTWPIPPDLISAPDGTPGSVQATVWAGGGASASLTQPGITGGGGGGGCVRDDHYPIPTLPDGSPDTSQSIPVSVGAGAQPTLAGGQPPPAGQSWFGPRGDPASLHATGGDTPPLNSSQNAGPGYGEGGPFTYFGGWSALPSYGGSPGPEGAGGGGGGAGSTGNGNHGGIPTGIGPAGQPGGTGGPGGGGQGGGGQNAHYPGTGGKGSQPGGGAGGAFKNTTGGSQLGNHGGDGMVMIKYLRSQISMQSVLLHMPNPDSDATFVPVINVGGPTDDQIPDGTRGFEPISPHPGMPVRYNGTYTVALTARRWGPTNNTSNVARGLAVIVTQYTRDGNQTIATKTLDWNPMTPSQDPLTSHGLVPMGSLTLPLRWVPPDNQTTFYTFKVVSSDLGDRFMDLLLLDVTGTTIGLIDFVRLDDQGQPYGGGGYSTWYVDEPDSGQSLGAILGSNYGRGSAVSATNAIASVSGGPFMLEPGTDNLLLAYSVSGNPNYDPGAPTDPADPGYDEGKLSPYLGAPALGADYYPRWWFDRADDLLTSPQDEYGTRRRRPEPTWRKG